MNPIRNGVLVCCLCNIPCMGPGALTAGGPGDPQLRSTMAPRGDASALPLEDPLPQGSFELRLGVVTVPRGTVASVPLTLSTTEDVQGIEVAFEWDGAAGQGSDLVRGPALSTADLVVTRVEEDYVVLGVVVDSNGAGPASIPEGQGLLLATAMIQTAAGIASETTTSVRLVDSKYSAVAGGPLLQNQIVVAGLTAGKDTGLELTDGSLTVTPGPDFVYKVVSGSSSDSSACGVALVLLDSAADVQGYEIALGHPSEKLELKTVEAGRAAKDNGADFIETRVLPEGGTIGVVMDLMEPFQNNAILPGQNLEAGVFEYCCLSRPTDPPAEAYALTFVDGVLGSPPKENTVVVGGVPISPELRNGAFTCTGGGELCNDGIDNDGDEKADCLDPDCEAAPVCTGDIAFACGAPVGEPQKQIPPAEGILGSTAKVCFYYRSKKDPVQGVSIAACTSCDELKAIEGTLDIAGSTTEAVKADYLAHESDTDSEDGDGCELIIGILVDAVEPLDGAVLPATDQFLRLGCITYNVASTPSLDGTCAPVTYCDGADGRGRVPIRNLVSVNNQSYSPQLLNCQVCLRSAGEFFRGDCNYSRKGMRSVDIADAAATVSSLFGTGKNKFDPPCWDACDCNDDGKVDLADVSCVLKYLFEFGPFPPAPGPGLSEDITETPPGPDPTPDGLDCKGI